MTGAQFLRAVKGLGGAAIVFRFPYTYLISVSEQFEGLDQEEREILFAGRLGTDVNTVRSVQKNNLISLQLMTSEEAKEEFGSTSSRSHHWIESFVSNEISANGRVSFIPPKIRTVHFYGYKGGQARSTLLAIMANVLADDGWKVVAIDSDIEAPSLDVIFSRSSRTLGSTILGITQGVAPIAPERIPAARGAGFIDLVPFRPQSPEFDIDAAALALRISLDPTILEETARAISGYAEANSIDVILIDHRAGLSPATLPWMYSLPGSTVICVRLDEQWTVATNSIRSILSTYPRNPGLFVSWKPDEEITEYYIQRNYPQVTQLLDILADAVSSGSDQPNVTNPQLELSFAELQDHWIIWPYDPAFRQARLPSRKELHKTVLDAIARLRGLLEIDGRKRSQPLAAHPTIDISSVLSPSGATDPGDLIQTEALRQLITPGNSISYVLGRKGTGKTRLLRELANHGIGEPLIVDPYDRGNYGMRSNSPELGRAAIKYKDNPIDFWWALLSAALEETNTETSRLTTSFSDKLERNGIKDPVSEVLLKSQNSPSRTFLMDGLETTFNANSVFQFIESLFRFLQIIETDSRIATRVQFKLFLRTDLAQRGYQNVEQQFHGRTIYLSWDTQKIFNFVLSRIARIPWYQQQFLTLVNGIRRQYEQVLAGILSIEECENLLMMAFPERLSTNNLSTKTFLRTYFADTASDKPELSTNNRLRYYPRVFDKFLEVIADPKPTELGSYTGPKLDRVGKISQGLIFFAHEAAAVDYIQQLRSELNYLINFSDDPNENSEKVNDLLAAFDGLKTPFIVDEHVLTLAMRTNISDSYIRSAMQRMKSLGLFEDRPGYPDEWRVGRLFKSALRMKYVRGTQYLH